MAEELTADVHRMLADKEGLNLDEVVPLAIADGKVLQEVLRGVVSKKAPFAGKSNRETVRH